MDFLTAYLARIGLDQALPPTRASLDRIALAHASTVPFENLDVLLGVPIGVDADAIFHKLVERRRGGYCFEQNALLHRALTELGFEATLLAGRARVDRDRSELPTRTHTFVRVDLDGLPFVLDVGVGRLSCTAALRMDSDAAQPTPHERRRIVSEGGRFFHQAELERGWVDVCEFTGEAMPEIDRVVANWYTSTHPASHFRARLMVARATPEGGRVTLLNDTLTIRAPSGVTTTPIPTWSDLWATLETHFGLVFGRDTRFVCRGLPFALHAALLPACE